MKKHLTRVLAFVFLSIFLYTVSGFIYSSPVYADVSDYLPDFANPIVWIGYVLAAITNTALGLAALLTGLGGWVLNFVVLKTVVEMASGFSNIPAINETWSAIRDLANMGFIFVLLYTAIQTIFGAGKYQQTIKNIVIAGILVNFSLFFTKVVIDVANLLALTFYNAIAPGAAALGSISSTGISNAIMDAMNITSIWKKAGTIGPTNLVTIGILGTIVCLIAAFIFFAVAILFAVRYVVLILVLVTSPIYFVAAVFPGGEGYKKQWEKALIGQAFFAPAYFIMTWITLKLFKGISQTVFPTNGAAAADALQGAIGADGQAVYSNDLMSVLLGFTVLIVFLVISVVVAKNIANSTGMGFSKVTSWATGKAGAATFGVAGRFGRGTVGRVGQVVADNEYLKDKAPTSRLARLGLAAGNKTAGASFDIRATGLNKNLDAGKAQKGGFAGDVKEKIKREKDYADNAFKSSDFVVNEAEQHLELVKMGTAPKKLQAERIDAREARKNNVDKLTEELSNASRKGAPAEEIKAINEKIANAQREIEETDDIQKYAQAKVDRLKGVDEKEATNRYKKELSAQGKTSREIDTAVKSPEGKAQIKALQLPNANNRRKEEYAKSIEEQKTFGGEWDITGRHFVFGRVKKEYKLQALAIRKSMKEKSNKDKAAEALIALAKEDAEAVPTPETTTPPPTPPEGGAPPNPTP